MTEETPDNFISTMPANSTLNWRGSLALVLGAVTSFTLAYSFEFCTFLIALYIYLLIRLGQGGTSRQAFYFGLASGVLICVIHLSCFYAIFGWPAAALWLVLGFWNALFVLLVHLCQINFKSLRAAVLIPFLWTGLEYFRSELYYLRFSWLNIGYVFSNQVQWVPIHQLGVYGTGFLVVSLVSLIDLLRRNQRIMCAGFLSVGLAIISQVLPLNDLSGSGVSVQVAGVQMEFPFEGEVLLILNKLIKAYPQAQLLALSEYTFDGLVPEKIKSWCRDNHRYLVVGGKAPTADGNFFDTAFVVDPRGEVIFQQAKSVPIQFFKDGLPAREQKLWKSPWGKIGICICYDLSYSRVTGESAMGRPVR